jgi:hypothetical protein
MHDRMPEFDCRPMKSARCLEFGHVLAVAPNDSALASFHDRQQCDLTGAPVEQDAALTAVLRA